MNPQIRIDYLKHWPDLVETVVKWVYPLWWAERTTFDEVVALYWTVLNSYQLPIGLIAFVNDSPAGTAIICEEDPDIHIGVTPWLEGLFVYEPFRRNGVGVSLVKKIEKIALEFGFREVYLSSGLENYYERQYFNIFRQLDDGQIIFRKKLSRKQQ